MSLTPEDKQWISQTLSEQLQKVESRFNEQFGKLETGLNEQLEGVETKLLTAFHDWSQPVNLRMRSHAADICVLQMDLEALQDRVTKLEEGKP